ncbi:MAG: metallophosphoesterase [Clostridiales bacterium]|nr:metallophosphoesterase [Clostridiales bacterium]
MKKILIIIVFILLTSSYSFGELTEVSVEVPEFEVSLNGEVIDSDHSIYPIFVYRDLTYFPMTSDFVKGLGIRLHFDGKTGIDIRKGTVSVFKQEFLSHEPQDKMFKASLVTFPIHINGKLIDNINEPYPLLMYKDVTYFPMTWRFAHDEFNLDYRFTNTTGLSIGRVRETASLLANRVVLTVGEDTSQVGLTFDMRTNEPAQLSVYNESLELISQSDASVESLNIDNQMLYVYKAQLKHLDDSTHYYYRIETDTRKSKLYGFKTIDNDTTLLFYGDIQGYKLSHYQDFYNVFMASRKNREVDINYIAGDLVDTGEKWAEWSYLEQAMLGEFSKNIMVTAIGNHDKYGSSEIYEKTFNYPKNGIEDLEERNFYFDLPYARVAVWDTESYSKYDEESKWLKDIMSKTDKFKLVLMHRSAYPMMYDEIFIRNLSKTFDEAGINLVLSGHDHIYNRTTMKNNLKVLPGEGVTYIVGGSGSGSKFYQQYSDRYWKEVIYDIDNPVYTVIDIKEEVIEIEAYALDAGESILIDQLMIQK